jgi:hypothetical protein
MRASVALAIAFVATSVDAAPLRTIRRIEDLRLVFLAGDAAPVHQGATGDALIDVGRITGRCAHGCPHSAVQRRFRLRVDGGGSARFVRVRAYLQVATPGQQVRIDGRLLTEAPQIIDAATPLGVAMTHTLEIDISPSAREGLLAESIVWIAEELQ